MKPGTIPAEDVEAVLRWTGARMPLVQAIAARWARERPLEGWRVSACVHLIATTASTLVALREAGADLVVCGTRPAATDPAVAGWLSRQGIRVLAEGAPGATDPAEARHAALEHGPHLIIDEADGLLGPLHSDHRDRLPGVRAASVHTLTGVRRMRSFAARGRLRFPVMADDGTPLKQIFDNRFGTGQSTLDAVMRTANVALPGACVVVVGYGHCGRGVAERARALGADVVVTEVDPLRALEAALSGYRVMPMADAAGVGDVFVTATGTVRAVTREHLARMKDGVYLANAGHSDQEFDVAELAATASGPHRLAPMIEEYRDPAAGRRYLMAGGGAVNTSAAAGHPPELMDLSFALQLTGVQYLVRHAASLGPGVHTLPAELERRITADKLAAMGIGIDHATAEQERYVRQVSGESDEEYDRTARRAGNP
ncbi:adenosylhomocysteinase [Actinomadura hibisca]|uniref:adenosylhomocysteinase n=1 Tax=Actinomadura hibisca TaxID=68565 RepID=UPI00082FA3C7|nr:adenosylhomocysteinase [Actinomadura hibisca]